jgi:O-antigen ligase
MTTYKQQLSNTINNILADKYTAFVNFLLFLFPIFVAIHNSVGDTILVILAFMGIYIAIKEKINPFKDKQLRVLSILTLGYYATSIIVFSVANNALFIGKYLQTDLYFLVAVFIAITIKKVNISIKLIILGVKIGLAILFIALLFGCGSRSACNISNVYVSLYAPMVATLTFIAIVNFHKENWVNKLFSIIVFIGGILLIIDTQVRMSWLVFIVLFIAYIAYHFKNKNHIVILSILTASIILVGYSMYNNNIINNRITQVNNEIKSWSDSSKKYSSIGIRLEMYSSGIKAFQDKPLFGHGYLNGTKSLAKYTNNERMSTELPKFVQMHSEYITTLVEKGLVGFLALLILIFTPLYLFYKRLNNGDIIVFTGFLLCVGFATFSLFNVSFGDTSIKSLYIFFLAILLPKINSINNKTDTA